MNTNTPMLSADDNNNNNHNNDDDGGEGEHKEQTKQ